MELKYLEPIYTSKGFDGKAVVIPLSVYDSETVYVLFSYGTAIAVNEGEELGIVHDHPLWDSATTLRHIKEFALQYVDSTEHWNKAKFEKCATWDGNVQSIIQNMLEEEGEKVE